MGRRIKYDGEADHSIARDLFKHTIPNEEGGYFQGEFFQPGKDIVWTDPELIADEAEYNQFKQQLHNTAGDPATLYLKVREEETDLVRYNVTYEQEQDGRADDLEFARFEGVLPADQYAVIKQNYFYQL